MGSEEIIHFIINLYMSNQVTMKSWQECQGVFQGLQCIGLRFRRIQYGGATCARSGVSSTCEAKGQVVSTVGYQGGDIGS